MTEPDESTQIDALYHSMMGKWGLAPNVTRTTSYVERETVQQKAWRSYVTELTEEMKGSVAEILHQEYKIPLDIVRNLQMSLWHDGYNFQKNQLSAEDRSHRLFAGGASGKMECALYWNSNDKPATNADFFSKLREFAKSIDDYAKQNAKPVESVVAAYGACAGLSMAADNIETMVEVFNEAVLSPRGKEPIDYAAIRAKYEKSGFSATR